jgi:precorrin-2 C20-methyltransferase/precorrin-3B C17-methyltransferase
VSGSVTVIGLGPGDAGTLTPDALSALDGATDLVGYSTYLDMVPDQVSAIRHRSDNREEAARAAAALDLAADGRRVVVVSSGDPGVFAMAAAVLEQLDAPEPAERWSDVTVEVLPGVTAAQATAARAGAPLGHDFAVISLSDNLKPWPVIERRLDAVAAADLVIALYNPASRARPHQLSEAVDVLLRHRAPDTVVVLGRDVGRPEESVRIVSLSELDGAGVDMRTVVIVGSSQTRRITTPDGSVKAYTPRRYPGSDQA